MPLGIAWGAFIFFALASFIAWYATIGTWYETKPAKTVGDNVAFMLGALWSLVLTALAVMFFLGIVGILPLSEF